ncbi:MAG: antifreeze protein [Rhodospirillales bacterium]|nr:antifreeze protein [Rhodospirillales bacterium]
MSGCRAERPARVGLAAALLLHLAVLPAAAQTGGPTPLFPPPSSQPPAPDAPAGTAPPGGAATTAPAPAGIETAPLSDIVNDAVGPLEGPTSLGADLWRGTSRSLAEALIPQIPAMESPAARAMTRRLLLTSAQPPEGAGTTDFIRLRAERLRGLGYAGDAASLLALTPSARLDAQAASQLADALLLAGDLDRACALASQNAALATAPAGERLQIFCALHGGDRDRAYFLYDLMREQGPEDPAFSTALAIADGGTGLALPKDAPLTPLLLAMLGKGNGAPPEAWYRLAEPAHLPRLLALPGSGEARAGAAERAARLGLIDPATLGAAYQALEIPAKELQAAAASTPETLRRRATLYKAAQQTADPGLKARLIDQALKLSPADALRPTVARLHAPFLRALSPAPDLARYAPAFARALFLAGDAEAARRWVALARANAADPGIAATLPGLALLAALNGENEPAWNRAARRFVERPTPTPEGARLSAIARLLPSDAGAATPQAAPPATGFFDPGLGLALRNAAAARRKGETVLFALIALGDRGPGLSDPGALAEALSALRQIGLEADARALAIEAAIANGA